MTETNRTQLVIFDMQDRKLWHILATMTRMLIPVIPCFSNALDKTGFTHVLMKHARLLRCKSLGLLQSRKNRRLGCRHRSTWREQSRCHETAVEMSA
jgi:hypothetical protein